MNSQVRNIAMTLLLGAVAGYFFGLKSRAGPVVFERVPATVTVNGKSSISAKVYLNGNGTWLVVADRTQYLLYTRVRKFVTLLSDAFRAGDDVATPIVAPPQPYSVADVSSNKAKQRLTVENHSIAFRDSHNRKILVQTPVDVFGDPDELETH